MSACVSVWQGIARSLSLHRLQHGSRQGVIPWTSHLHELSRTVTGEALLDPPFPADALAARLPHTAYTSSSAPSSFTAPSRRLGGIRSVSPTPYAPGVDIASKRLDLRRGMLYPPPRPGARGRSLPLGPGEGWGTVVGQGASDEVFSQVDWLEGQEQEQGQGQEGQSEEGGDGAVVEEEGHWATAPTHARAHAPASVSVSAASRGRALERGQWPPRSRSASGEGGDFDPGAYDEMEEKEVRRRLAHRA
jgi:hypothetical protein